MDELLLTCRTFVVAHMVLYGYSFKRHELLFCDKPYLNNRNNIILATDHRVVRERVDSVSLRNPSPRKGRVDELIVYPNRSGKSCNIVSLA